MSMNLKSNKHKRIYFNTTAMASLGFIAFPVRFSSPQNLIFCSGPPQLFWSEIFRSTPKISGGCYHVTP